MDVDGIADLSVRLGRLARADDPKVAVKLATELLDVLGSVQLVVSQVRDQAVLDLHDQGNSLHDIARMAHLTRGRVFQIVKRGRDALSPAPEHPHAAGPLPPASPH